MSEQIHVAGWDKFQHYKDRAPVWIKLHLDLHHRDAWLSLTPVQRALLMGIWIEYALSGRQVPKDTRKLSRRLNMRVTEASLDTLSDAGFILFAASAPLAQIREEKRREERALEQEQEPQELERVVVAGLTAWKVAS